MKEYKRVGDRSSVSTARKGGWRTFIEMIAWRPLPWLTIVVLVLTTLGVIVQLAVPGTFEALRRDPAALARGEWWRVVTPLFVDDGNPFWHFLFVSLGFVLVGAAAERQLGRARWMVLLLISAATGTVTGYLWDPYGAGASIALCGLIAGLAVWQIRGHELDLIASLYALVLAAALALEALLALLVLNELLATVILLVSCAILTNLLVVLRKRTERTRPAAYLVAGIILLSSLALVMLRDIHGAALLVGLIVAALLTIAARARSHEPVAPAVQHD